MAAIAVSLGSMIVGFSSGYTSPALPSMKEGGNSTSFTMTDDQVRPQQRTQHKQY